MLKIKEAKPMFNHVITTADRFENEQIKDGLIDAENGEGTIKPIQRIIKLGPQCVDGLNVGDYVLINPSSYSRPVHSLRENSVLERDKDDVQMVISFPTLEIDGREVLFLYDRDIDLVIKDFSEDDE